MYYIRDLPSKPKGKLSVELENIPRGKYTLEVYRIGYRVNDPYSEYITMGRPKQLTKQQVETLKQNNSGMPVATETVAIRADRRFKREIDIERK